LTAWIGGGRLAAMRTDKKWAAAALAAPVVLVSALLAGCAGTGSGGPGRTASATAPVPTAASTSASHATQALAQIERRFHARLGVYMLDTGTGRTVIYRAGERFAYCSTSKALSAAVLLQRSTDSQLSRVITYRASDLVEYSPITSPHVATGMRLRDVIAAAVQYSDNTAANLMVDQLGGPPGLQTALRGLGDPTTDVNRDEPALNDAIPGDARDTSTPAALGADLRRVVLGGVLGPARRQMLTNLLLGNTTGGAYIRAGVPSGWKVADKTGNGGYGTRNDIAIVWPPARSAIVIAILSDRGAPHASSTDALIAGATKAALAALS
jgi:beta-lactamase class A